MAVRSRLLHIAPIGQLPTWSSSVPAHPVQRYATTRQPGQNFLPSSFWTNHCAPDGPFWTKSFAPNQLCPGAIESVQIKPPERQKICPKCSRGNCFCPKRSRQEDARQKKRVLRHPLSLIRTAPPSVAAQRRFLARIRRSVPYGFPYVRAKRLPCTATTVRCIERHRR